MATTGTISHPTISPITNGEIERAMQRARHLRSRAFVSALAHVYRSISRLWDNRDQGVTEHRGSCTATA